MLFRSIALALLAFTASSAFAASEKEPFQLHASSTDEFRQQASQLRNEMATGRYSSLPSNDKKRVEKQLENLDGLYVKRATGASVSDLDAVALVNATSEINSVLTGDDDSRIVCERVKKLGSNRATKECMTVADRRAEKQEADRKMRDRQIFSGR